MTETCYYCGEPETSTEHAPPKCIFPKAKDSSDGKNYGNNLIKVPSCDAHNTLKSKEDEYLLYVLAMSLPSNDVGINQFMTKISRAVQRKPKLLDRLLIEYKNVTVHDTENDKWQNTIAIKPEEHRLNSIFEHIAKAIYFHETGCIWSGNVNILIEFMLSLTNVEQNERQSQMVNSFNEMLNSVEHKGNYPDVFSYQIVQDKGKFLIRMHFYGNSKVTAFSV